MVVNYLKIRKGTSYKTALTKTTKVCSDYLLNRSRRLKLETDITLELSGGGVGW